MATRRDLLLAVLALTSVSLLIAFGSIGLFTRMTPAIDSIIERNVVSLEATREMLGVFAGRWGEAVEQPDVARLEQALADLREALGPDGALLSERVVDTMSAAVYGERDATRAFVAAVADIAQLGYASMRAADQEAKRLGQAGAWSVAIGGLIACLLGIAVYLRLERRIARPTTQLARVLSAARTGDIHERCHAVEADHELGQALGALNHILDRDPSTPEAAPAKSPTEPEPNDAYLALVRLLERRGETALVMTPAGAIVAATPRAVARFMEDGGDVLREQVARAAAGEAVANVTHEILEPGRIVLVHVTG